MAEESVAFALGSRIKLRRLSQHVRLTAMARDLRKNKGHLSKVENNKAIPSSKLLEEIAAYLGISVDDLRSGPVEKLAPGYGSVAGFAGGGLLFGAPQLPVVPTRHRSFAERLARLIAMSHLSDEEQIVVEEYLLVALRAGLKMLRTRRVRKEDV